MSRDTYPRHRYAVTFSVTLYVDAETEDKAIYTAEGKLDGGGYLQYGHCERDIFVTLEDVARKGGA